MSESKAIQLTIESAILLLKKYSCNSVATIASLEEKKQLRQALLLATSLSEWENLGICANNETEGLITLKSYLKALGYQSDLESYRFQDLRHEKKVDGAVYIKFNTQKLFYYLDSYIGDCRGVLVSIQAEDDAIVGTYGHFPLDLFTA